MWMKLNVKRRRKKLVTALTRLPVKETLVSLHPRRSHLLTQEKFAHQRQRGTVQISQFRNAPVFQGRNVLMCPMSFQQRSAKLLPNKTANPPQPRNALRPPSHAAPRCPGPSVSPYPPWSARQKKGKWNLSSSFHQLYSINLKSNLFYPSNQNSIEDWKYFDCNETNIYLFFYKAETNKTTYLYIIYLLLYIRIARITHYHIHST